MNTYEFNKSKILFKMLNKELKKIISSPFFISFLEGKVIIQSEENLSSLLSEITVAVNNHVACLLKNLSLIRFVVKKFQNDKLVLESEYAAKTILNGLTSYQNLIRKTEYTYVQDMLQHVKTYHICADEMEILISEKLVTYDNSTNTLEEEVIQY